MKKYIFFLLFTISSIVSIAQPSLFDRYFLGIGNGFSSPEGAPNTFVNPMTGMEIFNEKFKSAPNISFIFESSLKTVALGFDNKIDAQTLSLESIGADLIDQHGGLVSIRIHDNNALNSIFGKPQSQATQNDIGHQFQLKWDAGCRFLIFKDPFTETKSKKLNTLPVLHASIESDIVLFFEGGNTEATTKFISLNFVGGVSFLPIKRDVPSGDDRHIFYTIFQDDFGNPAERFGATLGIDATFDLGKVVINTGFSGRFPNADIFGLQPRWYLSFANRISS